MDDKKIFEMTALELAYKRQLLFMALVMVIAVTGLILYIVNIYNYNLQLLLVSLMLITVSAIFLMSMDTKLKNISTKIRKQ